MDDNLRGALTRLLEPASERYTDALHDRMHEIYQGIRRGESLSLDEAIDGEIRDLSEEIRPYLQTLDQIRRTKRLQGAAVEAMQGVGGSGTAGEVFKAEQERLDTRLRELVAEEDGFGQEPKAVLNRIANLEMLRAHLARQGEEP